MILKEEQAKRVMKTLERVIMDSENKYVTDGHIVLTVDTFAPDTGLVREGKFDRIAVARLSGKDIEENDTIAIETIVTRHEYETLFARVSIRLGDDCDMYADQNGGYKFFDGKYLKPFGFPMVIMSEGDRPKQISYCPEHEFYIMPMIMPEMVGKGEGMRLSPLGRMLAIANGGVLFDLYKEELLRDFHGVVMEDS